jgi:hypothetical protein
MPITAAVIGAVTAAGVFAASRIAGRSFQEAEVEFAVEVAPAPEVRVIQGELREGAVDIRVDGVDVGEILQEVSSELARSLEMNEELTEEERERVQAAVERLKVKVKGSQAPGAPPAPEVPELP